MIGKKSFLEYLEEKVTAQQGFQYERNAVKVLKPLGIVPKNFTPAGAGSDQPDLMIQKDGVQTGCELKISAASAGSLVMYYDDKTGWRVGKDGEKDEEKAFIADLAKEVGVIDAIEKQWKGIKPYKFTKDEKVLADIEGLDKRAKYSAEKARYKDIRGSIPATKIEDYYNKKKTYYVNVGTDGFYLLGTKNPLGLKGIPRFGTSAEAVYRARVQAKGGGQYQFTFEMQFSIKGANRSPHNIAPVSSKTNVAIKQNFDLTWFLDN